MSEKNWDKSEYRKKFKTNGFRFSDSLQWSEFESFYEGRLPRKKCETCAKLITIIETNGEVRHGRACIGDKSCRTAEGKKTNAAAGPKKVRKPGEARVPWHGEYFRDLFFRARMPQVFAALDPEDPKMKVLKLVAIMKKDYGVMRKIATASGYCKGEIGYVHDEKVVGHVIGLPYDKIKALYAIAVEAVVMDGYARGGGFGLPDRRQIAEYLGINVAKEWGMTEEYLQKKTTAELMELGVSLKIFDEKKFKDYIARKFKKDNPAKCKKGELAEAIEKCGIKLVGRVPKEITD